MADTQRDIRMRLTGELKAAQQLVEMINVPTEERRIRDLVESASNLLRKAFLAAWESAEDAKSTPTSPGST